MTESNNDKPKKNPVPKNFQKNADIITNSVARAKNKNGKSEKNVVGAVGNGAIGSTKIKITSKDQDRKVVKKKEKAAVFSTRNIFWPGVGRLSKGYNIIERDKLEQWLTRGHIREATPEEVAREFGL